jgi:hypothetical protein
VTARSSTSPEAPRDRGRAAGAPSLHGLSDPSSCALTDGQLQFLARLDADEHEKLAANFPYVPCARPASRPPLWLASWRNTRQFLEAPRPRYRDAARRHWRALADSCDELLVITLSCGLEILNQCIDAGDEQRAISVIALGPVARKAPPLDCTLVRGEGDRIAQWFFPESDIVLRGAGHMDYLRHPATLHLVNERLCGNTSKSSAPVSTFRNAG